MFVPDILANGHQRYPNRDCVIAGERKLTFRQAFARAGRATSAFTSLGAKRGDRVALLARNELEYLEVLSACARGGQVVVPLNFRLHAVELKAILEDCRPSLLLVGPDMVELASQLNAPRQLVLGPGGSYEQALADAAERMDVPALDSETLWAIYYTGGTTGRPKGVMLTNGALYGRISEFSFELGLGPQDRFLQVQPMFHMASQISAGFALAGATNVLLRAFDPEDWFAAVARHRITHVLLVPTIINALCNSGLHSKHDVGSLRQIHYSASPISASLLKQALDIFRCDFFQSYGQTETGFSTVLPAQVHLRGDPKLLLSAGRPVRASLVEIVDDSGSVLPPGQIGEVVHRGTGQMEGYWNAPDLTASVMADGKIRTGDLGYMSEDRYLFLVDRKKDMIISGGENVYAREVEEALAAHPAVLEVAVIGVPHPHWGEAVHAIVVLRGGHTPNESDLIAHCRTRLAGYKVPKSVEFADTLPKTPVGKIKKNELREKYWSAARRAIN